MLVNGDEERAKKQGLAVNFPVEGRDRLVAIVSETDGANQRGFLLRSWPGRWAGQSARDRSETKRLEGREKNQPATRMHQADDPSSCFGVTGRGDCNPEGTERRPLSRGSEELIVTVESDP